MNKIKGLLLKVRDALGGGVKKLGGLLGPLLKRGLAFLKPVAKEILVQVVQEEGDKLQAQVREELAQRGPGALDALIDRWQAGIVKRLEAVRFLPNMLRLKAVEIVKEEGDRLQVNLKEAAVKGGMAAVDAVFDGAQAVLIGRIRGL